MSSGNKEYQHSNEASIGKDPEGSVSGGVVQRLVDLLPAWEMSHIADAIVIRERPVPANRQLARAQGRAGSEAQEGHCRRRNIYQQMQNVFKAGAVQPLLRQTGGSSTNSGTF